jgi:hypothetical protein
VQWIFSFFIPLVHGLNQFKVRRKSQSNPFNFSIQTYPFDIFLKKSGLIQSNSIYFFEVKYIVNSFFVVDHIYCQCFPLKILSMIPFFFIIMIPFYFMRTMIYFVLFLLGEYF